MLPEIPQDELSTALDACVAQMLDEADLQSPPVDALAVASRLGFVVARDERMQSRARFVRLAVHAQRGRPGMILLGSEPRRERQQWAVAHELAEATAHRVFDALGIQPQEAPAAAREQVANWMAGRLLLPCGWFAEDARRCDWDLAGLKDRYSTASHELIARRMLDFSPPVIITVFDQGRMIWRRSNLTGGVPLLSSIERELWHDVRDTCCHRQRSDGPFRVQCWPVHEPDWKREILRTEIAEVA